ncbi:MAG: host attachment protein [Pararhodobacter sp.]
MPVEKRKLWVLVMNASHARILRHIGWRPGPDEDATTPPGEITRQIEPRQLGDIMADRPGRSFASFSSRRSAMEYGSDPVAEETRGLIREVIALLEKHQHKGAFRELAIYAEPQVLGELRKMLPDTLSRLVVHEAAANFVPLDSADLTRRLNDDPALTLTPGQAR